VGGLVNGQAKRVLRLEDTLTDPPCLECGYGAPGPDTFEIEFVDEDEPMPDENVYCETCGRLIEGVLRFADDE
jgi:hypothetical protein